MADLPKTATMPSIKEDTRSYLEDEVASQGSGGKASREDSLVSGKGGRLRNMVHFTMKKKEEEGGRGEVPPGPTPLPPPYSEAVKQEEEGGGPGKILRKITTKSAKKKEKEDVVEFKLVEDLRLVTIPITSCLMVLISYIVFGAVLFSTWEVREKETAWTKSEFGDFLPPGLELFGRRLLLFHQSHDHRLRRLRARQLLHLQRGRARDRAGQHPLTRRLHRCPQEANAKLLLGTVYLLLGLGIISMCFNLMQEKIISQVCQTCL